jgi:type VI secretion system protein ImpH
MEITKATMDSQQPFDVGRDPSAFDFFAAVRLLERTAGAAASPPAADRAGQPRASRRAVQDRRRTPVGGDGDPRQEVVRFTAEPSLMFPVGDIVGVESNGAGENAGAAQPRMSVNFLGLIGPNGALPQHYTSLILSRLRERDAALRDFLDLFQHRSISLFYRAWKKYRLPFQYESSALPGDFGKSPGSGDDRDGVDLATLCLYCLAGLGTGGLRGRRAFDDRVCLLFSGTLSRQPRPALELERILADQMSVPVKVEQFFGRWLTLGHNELSRLPGRGQGDGYNHLGVNVVIGQRVRDVQGSFRIVLGPMTYRQFQRFTPLGSALRPVCEFTRSFAGPEFEFDVQVILSARQIPECRLDSTATDGPLDARGPAHPSGAGPRLGWNTWLRSNEIDREVDDAVFLLSDV